MKKIAILFFACLLLSFSAFCQDYVQQQPVNSKTYIGFGTGINNYLGLLGVSAEHLVSKKFTVYAGAGLGSWGNKLSFGARFYADYPQRWAFSLGYSHATGTGDQEIKIGMPADYLVGKSGPETIDVPLKLMSAGTLNFSALRFWYIGQRRVNRLNLEFGYALKMNDYRYQITNSERLNGSGIYFMDIMQPGGIILGAGLSFGL